MLSNYIKVALRYLLRNKQYTVINISGLAIAFAAGVLIIQFVKNEFSYDRFHSKHERIVRLWQDETYNGEKFISTTSPYSAAAEIKAAYPEVENFCRVLSFDPLLKYGDNHFSESARMVDTTFFQLFDFELIRGDKKRPFAGASSVLLTEEIAQKLFGSEDPMGKTIEMSLNNTALPFVVTGIVKPAPSNSSVKYKCLISYANAKYLINERAFNVWTVVSGESYLLLKEGTNLAAFETKLESLVKQHFGNHYKPGAFAFRLQPITDIHLNTDLPTGIEAVSDVKYSYILCTIGILLLLVASVNFIILSLGRSVSRYREVGVRKTLGAVPTQLIKQYWGESFIVTLCAAVLGFVIARFSFGPFNYFLGIQFDFVIDASFLVYAFLLVLLISLLAGVYPAFVLARHRAADTIRNTILSAGKGSLLQDVLITGQLVVSIAMIVCTFMVRNQIDYIATKDLGYKKERLVVIESHKRGNEGFELCKRLKTELGNSSNKDYTCSFYSLIDNPWFTLGFTQADKVYKSFRYNSIDANFIPTMGLELKSGRNFFENNLNDRNNSAIVNEAFVNYFNLTDPVGKKIPGPFHSTIVGVVKDFNYMSLHGEVEPLLMTMRYDSVFAVTENISFNVAPDPRLTTRLPAGKLSAGLAQIEQAWKKVVPGQQFDYRFVDDGLMAQYQNEVRMGSITGVMAGLSVFIACLGLFGLATLNVSRRTKEIGIRKVLGASNAVIIWLLSSRVVRMVLIAAVIAFPLTWYLISKWLSDFAFHAPVGWEPFLLASAIIFCVALMTISIQTFRAARENPVNSLKTQ